MATLTLKQIRFAHLVAESENESGTSLAKRAGYTDTSASEMASYNLKSPSVLACIEERKAQLAAQAGITPGLVLREWVALATTDASQIQWLKVIRCSECWPMADRELPVNPKCLACEGSGRRILMLASTESLTRDQRRLIKGYKQTKEGIEVILRDQDGALRNIADYLSMLNKGKSELSGPGGGPIAVANAHPDELTDEQMKAILLAAYARQSDNLGVSEGVSDPLALPSNTIEGVYEPV